jgi:hypothetical protein
MEPYDHRQHREIYANIAKRSSFFMVAPGKVDAPNETRGQVELGFRYFEGAASGAVLVGQPAECDAYAKCFPWPDAVIPVQADGSDVIDVLNNLSADPERTDAIRRRNITESLLRHDWIYRWKEILRVAGFKPWPTIERRERRLQELAASVSKEEKSFTAM